MKKSKLRSIISDKDKEIHTLKSKIGQFNNMEKFMLRDFKSYRKDIDDLRNANESLKNRHSALTKDRNNLCKIRSDLRLRLAKQLWKSKQTKEQN